MLVTMSSGTLMRSREPLGVVWTLAIHLVLEVLQLSQVVLGESRTMSQECDSGSSDAVLTRDASLDAHLYSSSHPVDRWKSGI